ncbi:carbon-nitrogen hydrolase family protein [Bremerella cremea]|uniref:Carbon-nitrogen hydrolase family protein n=1 Tax=Bremerella cremea TaxID=1031537 RepID=A0A368KZ36_9BACT|nr:carbon-nitrogen hydrolase family protein [Bremerella cremea]RCS56167.1 carbon-nitrogen hydrolase family protein [Bremerella cremea]
MNTPYLAAAIQLDSGTDKSVNLAHAEALIVQAATQGAKLVVLPELFPYLGNLVTLKQHAETMDGPVLQKMRSLASEHGLVLCAGSMAIASTEDPSKVLNRSVIFGPHGQVLAAYDKIHCFDINLADVKTVESDFVKAGSQLVDTSTSIGHVGQAICYDLRFPEIFRRLTENGMQICLLPAAFTDKTGQAHWEVLVRARAIENQVYVIAANQCGMYGDSIRCHGNSMIVDPWGTILARADQEKPGIIFAEIDLGKQRRLRKELPALQHRRMA